MQLCGKETMQVIMLKKEKKSASWCYFKFCSFVLIVFQVSSLIELRMRGGEQEPQSFLTDNLKIHLILRLS